MASRSSKIFSLSLAQGVMTLMSVISGMVFARYLSVSDYATYLQTFLAYDFCVPILTLGLPSALYYFLPGEKQNERGLVIDNLFLLLMSAMIFCSFLYFGGSNIVAKRFDNPDLQNTLRWMIPYPLYTFPIVLGTVLVIKDKVKVNAIYNVITGIILTSLIIISALFTSSYEMPTKVRIFLPLLYFPISLYLTFKYLSGNWRFPIISSMWKILKFSVPLGLASVCGTITLQLSNLIVSLYCSPEEYAIFATGAKEIPVIGIITGSIAVVTMTEMSQYAKKGNLTKSLIRFQKAAIYSAFFLFPLFIYLLLFARDFIEVMFTLKYAESLLPFVICLFLLPFRIVYWGSAYIALGYSKKILYRSIIELILTVILCFILVKYLGYWGAALSPVLVNYLYSLPYNLFSLSKLFKVSFRKIIPCYELSKIFVISLGVGLLSSIILLLNCTSLLRIFISGSLYVILYIISLYYFFPIVKSNIKRIFACLKK